MPTFRDLPVYIRALLEKVHQDSRVSSDYQWNHPKEVTQLNCHFALNKHHHKQLALMAEVKIADMQLLSNSQQEMVKAAAKTWEQGGRIQFNFNEQGNATGSHVYIFNIHAKDMPSFYKNSYGYANYGIYFTSKGSVKSSPVSFVGLINGYKKDGRENFETMVHELGHVLGLGHPHDSSLREIIAIDELSSAMNYNHCIIRISDSICIKATRVSPSIEDLKAVEALYGNNGKLKGDQIINFDELEKVARHGVKGLIVETVYVPDDGQHTVFTQKEAVIDISSNTDLANSDDRRFSLLRNEKYACSVAGPIQNVVGNGAIILNNRNNVVEINGPSMIVTTPTGQHDTILGFNHYPTSKLVIDADSTNWSLAEVSTPKIVEIAGRNVTVTEGVVIQFEGNHSVLLAGVSKADLKNRIQVERVNTEKLYFTPTPSYFKFLLFSLGNALAESFTKTFAIHTMASIAENSSYIVTRMGCRQFGDAIKIKHQDALLPSALILQGVWALYSGDLVSEGLGMFTTCATAKLGLSPNAALMVGSLTTILTKLGITVGKNFVMPMSILSYTFPSSWEQTMHITSTVAKFVSFAAVGLAGSYFGTKAGERGARYFSLGAQKTLTFFSPTPTSSVSPAPNRGFALV